jgi:putative redox protein
VTEPAKGPTVDLDLLWKGELRFEASTGATLVQVDGDGRTAVSPVQALVVALAGCMASDLVLILTRGRQPLSGLRAHVHAQRAAEDPRRLLRVEMTFTVEGAVPPDKVQHAIDLSRDKYCSVWHSLRPDIELVVAAL